MTDMVTLGVELSYNGAPFAGFAKQPDERLKTVQGELEQALATLFKQDVPTVCAGRTDAGVHARDQWISFQVPRAAYEAKGDRALRRSLNALTDIDISIRKVEQRADDFSARFDARTREYRYFISDSENLPVLLRHVCWHVRQPLDLEAMQRACTYLVGEHDFKSFCLASSAEGKNTVRTVMELTCEPVKILGERLLCVRIVGSAFLHSMVRTIVGTLVLVGRGRREPQWVETVLAACDREAAGEKAPACGLVFWHVDYDNPEYLSAKERFAGEAGEGSANIQASEPSFAPGEGAALSGAEASPQNPAPQSVVGEAAQKPASKKGGFKEAARIRDEEMPSIMEGLDFTAFDTMLKNLTDQADEALRKGNRVTDPADAPGLSEADSSPALSEAEKASRQAALKADEALASFLAANCTSAQRSQAKGLYGDGASEGEELSDIYVKAKESDPYGEVYRATKKVEPKHGPVTIQEGVEYAQAADPLPAEGEESLVLGSRGATDGAQGGKAGAAGSVSADFDGVTDCEKKKPGLLKGLFGGIRRRETK